MIQYGLISSVDARCLEKTIDLICEEFTGEEIHVTEIGVFDGQTARGIYEYITRCKVYSAYDTDCMDDNNFEYECIHTAIDNNKDKVILKPFPECNLIIGNSNEVYNQLEDNSQHLIFVDGDHSLIGVISDFYAYADKIKVGGYFCFHDTGKHIAQFKDFQHGDKNNPDAYISVRKALEKIGLFNKWVNGNFDYEVKTGTHGWQLISDEADTNDDAGGICVFKKLY